MHKAQHRAENLSVRKVAGGGHIVENGRPHEVARLVARDLRVASIEENLRALLLSDSDQRLHSLFALRSNYRTHLHAVFEAVADFQFRSRFSDRVAECLLRFADRYGHRNREATLSGTTEGAVANDLCG